MIRYSIVQLTPPSGDSGYYAKLQYTDKMDLSEFAQHIADHGCTYDKADIAAVLTKAVACIRELILEGYRITLGDLGTFFPSIKCEPADSAEDFTATNITDLKIKMTPGDEFKDLRDEADFTYVLTREAEAAALAAAKAGTDVTTVLTSDDEVG